MLLFIQCLDEDSVALVIMPSMCFKTLSTLIVSHIASAVSSLHSAFMCLFFFSFLFFFPPCDTCVRCRTDSVSEAIH